jgi:hypothetical protein
VLASDFGGTVSIDYHPTGVVCLLVASIPSSQRASEDATR